MERYHFYHYVLRLVLAMIAGGLIGIEREIKGKPAGMRTNILMSVGSCLLMLLSLDVFRNYHGTMGDPARLAAGVVMGIGFLGAGTIIQSRFNIHGLTTAATLWLVAAIGLVIGWGNYLLAGAATVLILLTLTALSGVQRWTPSRQRHALQFELPLKTSRMQEIKKVLNRFDLELEYVKFERGATTVVVALEYVATTKRHNEICDALAAIEDVEVLVEF